MELSKEQVEMPKLLLKRVEATWERGRFGYSSKVRALAVATPNRIA